MLFTNGQLSCEINHAAGEWASLRFRGEEWIKTPGVSPFFQITALDVKNEKHVFVPAGGSVRGNSLFYASLAEKENIADIHVEAQFDIERDDGLSIGLKVCNCDPRYTVTEILCMQLEGSIWADRTGSLRFCIPITPGKR